MEKVEQIKTEEISTVKQVFFLYQRCVAQWITELISLTPQWDPSLMTGTSPPSCLLLDNRLFMPVYIKITKCELLLKLYYNCDLFSLPLKLTIFIIVLYLVINTFSLSLSLSLSLYLFLSLTHTHMYTSSLNTCYVFYVKIFENRQGRSILIGL